MWQVSFLPCFFSLFPFLILCSASVIFTPEGWALPPQGFLFNPLLLEQCSSGTDKGTWLALVGVWLWGSKVAQGDQENLYLSLGCLAPSFSSWSELKGKSLYD